MASVRYLTDILARIKDGDPCSTRDWDNKVVPRAVKKILKKYDLMGPITRISPSTRILHWPTVISRPGWNWPS